MEISDIVGPALGAARLMKQLPNEDYGLTEPHDGMTPTEKAELLRRYVKAGRPLWRELGSEEEEEEALEGLDFSGARLARAVLRGADLDRANLDGAFLAAADLSDARLSFATLRDANLLEARLDGATLEGCDLSRASLINASLKGANLFMADLTGAALMEAELEGADFSNADLSGAHFLNSIGTPAKRGGARLSYLTYERSNWTPQRLLEWTQAGAHVVDLDAFPDSLQHQLIRQRSGLTLTFDTRLHRFDDVAMNLLIAEVLGSSADLTIEERSNIDVEGPSFLRINGSDPEELAAVAEAFYDRVWRSVDETIETMAVQRAMSSGIGLLLGRLDQLRDSWASAAINHPDVSEMLLDQSAVHAVEKDRPSNLHGRFERVLRAVAGEAKKKATKAVGTELVDAVGDATTGLVDDILKARDRRAQERWERELDRLELDDEAQER